MRRRHLVVVHYRLLEAGRILQASERVTGPGPHENVWIFERAGSTTGRRPRPGEDEQ